MGEGEEERVDGDSGHAAEELDVLGVVEFLGAEETVLH